MVSENAFSKLEDSNSANLKQTTSIPSASSATSVAPIAPTPSVTAFVSSVTAPNPSVTGVSPAEPPSEAVSQTFSYGEFADAQGTSVAGQEYRRAHKDARLKYEPIMPCTVISLDVGGTKITGAVVSYTSASEEPEIIYDTTIPTEAQLGGSWVLKRIENLAEQLMGYAPTAPVAIGVGTNGHVDRYTGSIATTDDLMPGWDGQPVESYLVEHFGIVAGVLNDVQAYALGELYWGAARGCTDVLVAAVGTGLGGAIIANGHLLQGAHGFAGEIGHTLTAYGEGLTCSCGHLNHVETVTSGSGIEAAYVRAGGKKFTGAQISERAQSGDELAISVIQSAGFTLGASLGSWVSILDPERIILGGSVSRAGEIWESAVREGYVSQCPKGLEALPIVSPTLGSHAPVIGAAEYALEKLALKLDL